MKMKTMIRRKTRTKQTKVDLGRGGRKLMEQDEKEINEGAWERGGSKHVEANKPATKDPALE
jgi:hypothetical protein